MQDTQDEAIPINIGNICDGAMVEAFELKLADALRNIMDPSTEARSKREIVLRVKFHPKDDRVQINYEFTCDTKLAGLMPATSRMFVGRDAAGALYALSEDPRQMHIFTPPAPRAAPAPLPFVSGSGAK